jgi:hypothetical protein
MQEDSGRLDASLRRAGVGMGRLAGKLSLILPEECGCGCGIVLPLCETRGREFALSKDDRPL